MGAFGKLLAFCLHEVGDRRQHNAAFRDAPDQVIGGHADDHPLLDTVQALDLEEGSKCKVPLARKHLATRVVSSR